MKTKIKRNLILFTIGFVLICSSSLAETWKEFLNGKTWLLQNPNPINQALMLNFVGDNSFISTGIFMDTGQQQEEEGKFEISSYNNETIITLVMQGIRNSFKLKYVNENKIILVGKRELVYAIYKSSEDNYLETLKRYKNTQNPFISGQSYPSYNTGGKMPCHSCNMTGKCGGCNGTGKVPGYPYGTYTPCWVCGGTGTCKFCYGTGYISYGLTFIGNCGYLPQFFC